MRTIATHDLRVFFCREAHTVRKQKTHHNNHIDTTSFFRYDATYWRNCDTD